MKRKWGHPFLFCCLQALISSLPSTDTVGLLTPKAVRILASISWVISRFLEAFACVVLTLADFVVIVGVPGTGRVDELVDDAEPDNFAPSRCPGCESIKLIYPGNPHFLITPVFAGDNRAIYLILES